MPVQEIMKNGQIELRPLRYEDETSFASATEEFSRTNPSWQFALSRDRCGSFAEYVDTLDQWSRGVDVPEGFVPATFLVGIVKGQVVGRLSLRHRLNDFLERIGGHIGYGVVPSYRRKGYATAMLKQAIPIYQKLGLQKVLLTCNIDNIASQKVIESCGGEFEGITNLPELKIQKRRYWIQVASHIETQSEQVGGRNSASLRTTP